LKVEKESFKIPIVAFHENNCLGISRIQRFYWESQDLEPRLYARFARDRGMK
jgi:hypothetical protein